MNYAQIRWSAGNEPRAADTTGDRLVHTSIKLTRLIRKTEERKKDKRARHQQPSEYLEAISQMWVILPNDAWDLDDLGIVAVRVGPAFPRLDTRLRIGDDEIRPQRNGPEYLDARNGHQAEVQATTGTLGMRHLLELTLALVERADGYD
jgi:hypothetical protein